MYKLGASIKKEMLILFRDKIGLSILFIMPIVLIFVMTLIQDSAFKTINEKGIPIVLVNNDKDSLGNAIYRGLKTSTLVDLTDKIDGKPATPESLKKAVAEGKFILGIVVPEGATKTIRDHVSNLVNETITFEKTQEVSPFEITLVIDPVAKKTFVTSVTSSLHEFLSLIHI